MNLRTTYILFALLLVVLLVFAATQLWKVSPTGTSKEQYIFADFHSKNPVKTGEIDTVRIDRGEGKEAIAFTRGKDGWQMTAPFTSRTDTFQVDNLVRQVTDAEREKSEMSSNLKEYDLDPPPVVVTLKKGDQEWKLNVGKQTGGVVYVSNAAEPKQPAAVRKASLDAVFKKVNDFRARELLTANASNTSAVQLAAGESALALEKTSDGRWRFQKPPYGPANFEGDTPAAPVAGEKKVGGVRDLIDDAGGLRVETENDFVAHGVGDAELADKYGLGADRPATLRVEVKVAPAGGEAKTEVLLIGKKAPPPEEKKDEAKSTEKKAEKPETKAEYDYARLAGENSVVRVPAAKVKPLLGVLANPDPLRSHDLVSVGVPAKIDAVDVQAGGVSVKLRNVDNKWKLYHNGARATDAGAVNELIDAVTGKKQVKTFVDKPDGLEFDKPAAIVSVWIDGVKKDEKKDEEKKEGDNKDEKNEDKEPALKSDKPTVKLTFGKRDRDKGIVYVQREAGEDKTIVTVADSVLDKVTAGPMTYVDRQLPSFAQGFDFAKDVTKLALERGGQTWELAKETAGDKTKWKIVQPQSMAGRGSNEANVNQVLTTLAHLRAEKIVAEKAKEDELGPLYGLKPPVLKATVAVTRDGKPEEWTYTFGKQSDTKMGVYAQLSRSDFVFLVPKATVDQLASIDLRDPTVFNFEMAKVKDAKIAGWSGVLGSVYTLDLQRKGDKDWTATGPPGFTADGAVVESFLSGLSHMQAGRFVTAKGDPELDVNKGALQIDITVEGEKEPLRLTIGKEDPDNMGSYFAKSSTQGDAVFLVPKASFEKAKEKPAFFKKG
jgi:hypothetical protein